METIQQRNSRVNADDLAATSQHHHLQDVRNCLASYEILPSDMGGFLILQKTPSGQQCTSSKTMNEALDVIKGWHGCK